LVQEKFKVVVGCEGCAYVTDGYCTRYPNPAYWWDNKSCPMVAKVSEEIKSTGQKQRVGQQKQAKQRNLSKKTQQTYSRLGK